MENVEIKLGTVGLERAVRLYGLSCIQSMGTLTELTTVSVPSVDAALKFRRPSYRRVLTQAEREALQHLYSGYSTGIVLASRSY